jgi:hypothetical protein
MHLTRHSLEVLRRLEPQLCSIDAASSPQPTAGGRVRASPPRSISREWHLSPGGRERTMSRRARMSSLGIIVLHFTPRQIRSQPKLVAETIRSTLEAAANRPALPIRALAAL